ncbi:EboA domain-containing protein [Microbacterium sp. gxy059]|uniref:EboA domain-containing protein n=1 Tax=Microbacterium sp. gxy059 TaxID=2957199 RepID=UPI003D96268C
MTESNTMTWAPGYGTNGFAEHALDDCLDVIQTTGYEAVALTLGPAHFDPFASDWRTRAEALADDLARRGLRVVVETGAPYALDAFRPFRPSLADRDAISRVALLERAIEIGRILRAECVSLWSGELPDGADAEEGWRLIGERLRALADQAERAGVRLSIEPEPGMIVETVAQARRWIELAGAPAGVGITVDLGHCIVVDEPGGVAGAIRAAGDRLFNVQVDDMPTGVHDHRALGDGDLDLAAAFAALDEIGYAGVAALELPRHSGDAPRVARESLRIMRDLAAGVDAWTRDAIRTVSREPERIPELVAEATRAVGRGAPAMRARVALLGALPPDGSGADAARRLYQRGDADERIAVLRALGVLPDPADAWIRTGREIVADALRANDPRIVAAAMGAFAERHLDAASWRQGVLKLVFMGEPLAQVAGLERRRDDELADMADHFAQERRAAGRTIPEDLALIRGVRTAR